MVQVADLEAGFMQTDTSCLAFYTAVCLHACPLHALLVLQVHGAGA
jgi:hypothetical protein